MAATKKQSAQNYHMRFAVGTLIAVTFMVLLVGANGLRVQASLTETETIEFESRTDDSGRIVYAHLPGTETGVSYVYENGNLAQINRIAAGEKGLRRITVNVLQGDAVAVEPDGTLKQYNVIMSSKPFETIPEGYERLTEWPASETVMTHAIGRLIWHSDAKGLVRLYDEQRNLIQELPARNTL